MLRALEPAGETCPITPQELGIGICFDKIHEAVIVLETNARRIVLWNRAATEIFGYTEEEARSLPLEAFMPPRIRGMQDLALDRYNRGRDRAEPIVDSRCPFEQPCMTKDGREIVAQSTFSTLECPHRPGEAYLMAITRDVTENRRLEALAESLLTVVGSRPDVRIEASFLTPEAPIGIPNADKPPQEKLGRRELEVLALVAQGLTNGQIARKLRIAQSTVKTHLARITHKLGVNNRAQAAAKAVKQGLLA